MIFVPDARWPVDLLSVAADDVASRHGLPRALVFDSLWRREQAASTAMGHGFAVPHARIPGLVNPITTYLRTAEALDFGGPERSSHFLVLLVPRDGRADEHLQLLAAIARMVSDRRFRTQLNRANDATAANDAFRSAVERVIGR